MQRIQGIFKGKKEAILEGGRFEEVDISTITFYFYSSSIN
jgi:hypothetical protein